MSEAAARTRIIDLVEATEVPEGATTRRILVHKYGKADRTGRRRNLGAARGRQGLFELATVVGPERASWSTCKPFAYSVQAEVRIKLEAQGEYSDREALDRFAGDITTAVTEAIQDGWPVAPKVIEHLHFRDGAPYDIDDEDPETGGLRSRERRIPLTFFFYKE